MSSPIIKVESLYKSFGNKNILNNLSFEMLENESCVILGKSGNGKSVLFKCIVGILKPDCGKIFIKGIEVNNISEKKRFWVNKDISMVFQNSALFDSYNILDNITFGIINNSKVSKKERVSIATDVLEKVGLDSSILYLFPTELSGGMQKRVAIARAIATKPKIILFDEPTSGLDPISSNLINKLITDVTKYLGATSLTITHDIQSAKYIASKVLLLNHGSIVWQGTVEEVDNINNKLINNFINGIAD